MSRRIAIAVVVVLLVPVSRASAHDGTAVNLPARVSSLDDDASKIGLHLTPARSTDFQPRGQLLIWEARAGGNELSPEVASRLGDWTRKGGRLLLTFSDDPGLGPMRLSFLLPTTAWRTQAQAKDGARSAGGTILGEADRDFFPKGLQLRVPFYFPLRPFDSVERGEGRYERFPRTIPYIDLPVPPGNSFWTRPLLNRDWRIRARAGDVGRSPVLLTGRYGAGRVAVFGASAAATGPDAGHFWTDLLGWLLADEVVPVSDPTPLVAPTWEVDWGHRLLHVTVRNPGAARSVHVIARLCTWEHAIVGDVEKELELPAMGLASAEIPLPAVGTSAYQALECRDEWDVRLGILSGDGSTLLSESRIPVDLRPPLVLTVRADNLRHGSYPFHAPGPQTPTFPARMGMEVDAYSCKPGTEIPVSITIANGVRNIAPLAAARDETQPNNPSTVALIDEAAHGEQRPGPDKVQAWGNWTGMSERENVLSFVLPVPMMLSAVTLVGSPDNYRNYLVHNPGVVIVEADGQAIAEARDLDARFTSEFGAVRLAFPPRQVRVIRLRLPWLADVALPEGRRHRAAPWLAEVRIDGTPGSLPAVKKGTLSLVLRDAMTGVSTPIDQRDITVPPGQTVRVNSAARVPAGGPRFYRVEAAFETAAAAAPLLAIDPATPLQPVAELKSSTAPDLGFIVTRGFRNVFDIGTGTAELADSWGTPDDLVWAYSHQMKQIGRKAATRADRMYVSESDMRHYSTPWRSLPDGEYFYDLATPMLVDRMKQDRRWAGSSLVILSHSDRWDCAPDVDALHGWQDFVGFDDYLRASGAPGLTGRTRKEIAAEIHAKYEHRWLAWQLSRYVHAIRELREAFAKEGKRVLLTAQGAPLVPSPAEAEIAQVVRGESDDSTWGMIEESAPLTTGRQMGILAFNPGWAMSTLLQWGFDSAVLNNPHWHNAVGTTEPSRRNIYDRAWRGTIGRDGAYRSMHTYAYNTNAGVSFTMTENDWQQWWNVEERHSLISPDGPIGVGVVISTARFADPDRASFSGSGGWGASEADAQVRAVARVVRRFEEAGVSVPFSANAAALDRWSGAAPLVLLDVDLFSEEELAVIARLKVRGVKLAGFMSSSAAEIPKSVAAIFNVPGARPAGSQFVEGAGTLFVAASAEDLSGDDVRPIVSALRKQLALPITFPAGTAGYGFTSQGMKFVVVNDWLEQGRVVSLRIRTSDHSAAARAVDVNDHRSLAVVRDGDDWVIELPIRPGDGTLVAIEESR